jgi:GAF domain-containing protein
VIDFERFLARLGSGVESGALSQSEAAHYIGEHVARRVYCSSATLWTISGTPVRRVLTRLGGFDAAANRPLAEPMEIVDLHASEWYDALCERRIFVSSDTAHDTRLPGFHDAAVGVRAVRGMLQAAIGANASLVGFISCTQHDVARAWTPREITLVQRIAISLTIRRTRAKADEARAVPGASAPG